MFLQKSKNDNHCFFFLLSLQQTRKSYPAIRSSAFAIKYCHKIVGYHDPCNSELFNYVLEGIKRICCHTPKKKIPFTRQLLHTSYRSLGENNMNLINLKTMFLCVLGFMGFLRFCEIINLMNSDIVLQKKLVCLVLWMKAKLMYTEKAIGYIYLNYSRLSVQ